jgi:hypothetical protein
MQGATLTDPDVRISRFRFFTGEVRSQQRAGVTVDGAGSRQGMAPDPRLQRFVDHLPRDAIRDSSVEKVVQWACEIDPR